MKFPDVILLVATTLTALMAGLFFAYSVSVSLGLQKLSDIEYIKAMQSINREIQNPLFFSCFFGALLLLPWACIQQYSLNKSTFLFLLAASVVYGIGVFGVTIVANVPLNNQLDAFSLSTASSEQIQKQRSLFEGRWNIWNHVRTIASLVAVMAAIGACLVRKGN
ncbi:DUF1772 domain-containing protein [Cytophagaceae bacterium DM2B3-1]|uniref:DUF1772 domain-containing protein n=2 Tax=Xanthocytophaga flava TaxID=3048013 RepID=A0ABT7CUB9_9BACT|nr:DUF1772 domain-containing protein [Xanthocytophaga flavus]